MCGFTGFIDHEHITSPEILQEMITTLNHRGPDDKGIKIFYNHNSIVGLAHARLSIIDLSSKGHQPMNYMNYTIVYNGEIYNYKEIKEELKAKGHTFISNSDTEVILHAFEEWNTDSVNKFNGMFSFVIYDNLKQILYGFRDRAGAKPFYYYCAGNIFLFGSELKSFHKHPEFSINIDQSSLICYFDLGYVPSPYSIFEKTSKLEPGHYFSYDINNHDLKIMQYWSVLDYYTKPKLSISYTEALEQVHELLKSAFQYRMISDVPVGIFLSGGFDSTAVAAILQSQNNVRLKTFTIGFEQGNNEAPYAKETATYLDTDHFEYYCTIKESQDIISELPYYYDEPFADSSAIPTVLVSKFARKYVTVALSADGGDEIFAGYSIYPLLMKRAKLLNKIPKFVKPYLSTSLSFISCLIPEIKIDLKHRIIGLSKSLNKDEFLQNRLLLKHMSSLPDFYRLKIFKENIIPYNTKYDIDTSDFQEILDVSLAIDYQTYLNNDILTKIDRASMSVSLEGREPFLDHRILELVARLPRNYKIKGNYTKRILRDIVYKYLPVEMMNRPKTGFSLPIYSWLRGDLNYILDEYLSHKAINKSGIFNAKFVTDKVRMFRQNHLHYVTLIWKILMYQMWFYKWMK